MSKPPVVLPEDLTTLPARIPLPVVMAICRYGRVTLWRRVKQGRLAKPIDRGGEGLIWLRDDVLTSLGLIADPQATRDAPDPWDIPPGAWEAAEERNRESPETKRWLAKLQADRAAKKAAGPKPRPAPQPKPKAVPTEPKDLGKYVVMKPRACGRYAVYFQVSKKLRPKGWRPTINLPLHEPRTGDMTNRSEVARIRADAITLHKSMRLERTAQLRQASEAEKKKPDA